MLRYTHMACLFNELPLLRKAEKFWDITEKLLSDLLSPSNVAELYIFSKLCIRKFLYINVTCKNNLYIDLTKFLQLRI